MSRVEELERAVSELPPDDLRRFREWFAEFDHALWDRQLDSDSAAGRLDALVDGALAEHKSGQSRPL
jgi:hypothetical protein